MSEKPKPLSPSQLRAERQLSAEIPPSTARHPRGQEEWQDFISNRIEEAMREGAFDDLPGKGKPLKLNENPNEPSDMVMANSILKNNDASPLWIGDRKKLLEDIEALRAEMSQRWGWMQEDWAAPDGDREWLSRRWAEQIAAWKDQIAKLNSRILSLNLILPIWRLELLRLHLAEELKRIGAPERLGEEG
ncbi:MAG: DnaJ family domain-containing protein [Caldilineaceae bacterium]